MKPPENLLDNIPATLPEEIFETILSTQDIKIERIISHGHSTSKDKWYDQALHEWVLILQGNAKLELQPLTSKKENKIISLHCGDHLNIPAHTRHRVVWTDSQQPTIWLAIHYSNHC